MVTLAMTVSAATFAPRVAGMSTTPSTEWFAVSGPDAATNPRRFVSSSDSLVASYRNRLRKNTGSQDQT